MKDVVLKATTGKDGAIHIERTDFEPGVEVEVRVQPLDVIHRYGLIPYRRLRLTRRMELSADPIATQRQLRAEWEG